MNYKIVYYAKIEKIIEKIPKRDAKLIKEKIEDLSKDPRPNGSIKLTGKESYRIRQGNYRIIYQICDNHLIVYILDVDARKNVYRK